MREKSKFELSRKYYSMVIIIITIMYYDDVTGSTKDTHFI